MTQTHSDAQGVMRSGEQLTSNSKSMERHEKTLAASTEEMLLPVEMFIEEHYQLRRNVLSGMVEYKKSGEPDENYTRLSSEDLNTIFLQAKREMPDVKNLKTDLKAYVESSIPPSFNPIETWLDSLPAWDGTDRVEAFLNRIPGLPPDRMALLKIWLRSTVAHWLGLDQEHGNETVPLLIGSQGCGKSTFCVRMLPPHLRQYYLDHFNLVNKFDKEMALTGCLLICLDEIDQYTVAQMAQLKQALSKVKVNGRKIYGKTIEDRRRFASFIATTNNRHPLVDKTGSRRYITIEIAKDEIINNTEDIEYGQLFAQIIHEIRDEKMRYWFTNEETELIQQLNAPYEQTLDLEQMIDTYFRKPHRNEKSGSFTSMDIRKVLKSEYPDVAESQFTSIKIGMALKEMKVAKVKSRRGVSYSLVRQAA